MKIAVAPCFLTLLILLFTSCEMADKILPATEMVTITLPPAHPLLPVICPERMPTYTIRWYDAKGTTCSLSGCTGNITIELEKGLLTPVLIYPETDNSTLNTAGLIAGALYPVHAGANVYPVKLETDWTRGITASVAEDIINQASGGVETGRMIAAHFNWPRFDQKIAEFENPLSLDRQRFVESVLSGSMTIYDITRCELFSVTIVLKDGTVAVGTSFFSAGAGTQSFLWPATNSVIIEAPEGLSRYFGPTGYVKVQIVHGKIACCFFSTYSLQE